MRLFGRNPVIERLRAQPRSVKKIFIQEGAPGLTDLKKKAKQLSIPVNIIPASRMLKISKGKNAQGILADVENFDYANYDEVLQNAVAKHRTMVFLDNVTDPQNLGAIIRSLACIGRFAIIIPTHDSASVNETVLRVACGGENYIPIVLVANINKAIRKAKDAGFWILGTVVNAGTPIEEVDMPVSVGIVFGSEQSGIRDVIRKSIDIEVTMKMPNETLSLNVAHAATLFCYEITRQKKQYKNNQHD